MSKQKKPTKKLTQRERRYEMNGMDRKAIKERFEGIETQIHLIWKNLEGLKMDVYSDWGFGKWINSNWMSSSNLPRRTKKRKGK